LYGFEKSLVLLSDAGKMFGLSAYDGRIMWSKFFGKETPQKMLTLSHFDRSSGSKVNDLAVIQDN
jgi:hypothetical protein